MKTNKTYEYFVDWHKVYNNVRKFENEIQLISVLSRYPRSRRIDKLFHILKEYPKVSSVIPILVAVRIQDGCVEVFDVLTEETTEIRFNPSDPDYNINDVLAFSEKVGIIDLFDRVQNIYDYVLGIEVGLDTNSQKNRSGKIFEEIIFKKLEKIFKMDVIYDSFVLKREDRGFSLYDRSMIGGRGMISSSIAGTIWPTPWQ